MTDFRPSESSGPERILHSHGGKACRLRAVGCVTSTALGMAVWLSLLPAPVVAAVRVEVGQASGYAGWVVDLPVTLAIEGEAPSSVGHTLFFPDPRSVKVQRRSDGEPDCTPAAGVATPGRFAFWPVGCVYEEDECDAVTALFVDLSGTLPNLPAGPLFSCKVGISTAAVPGTYPVQNVDPESSARRGRALSTTGTDGAVQVLQPPGGGGCAVMPERGSAAWWLAMLLAVVLYRGLRAGRCQRAFVGSRHTWIGAMLLFMAVVLLRGGALAQATEVYVEGRWYGQGKEGTWAGELVVAENGSVSGQVRFAGLEALPAANVLAVWSASGLRQGSLFRSGGAVRAGRLRGSWGAAGVAGEFTVADGSLFAWELRTVRAKREKAAPPRASALLARGQPATVVVGLDDYPAVRAARARSRNLALYEWDSEDAEAAYNQTLAALREQVLSALDPRSVAVIQRNRLLPSLVLQLYDFDALSRLLTLDGVRSVGDRQVYYPLLR
ncbi:MAG: hypothetical protein KatS3mg077_3221 [Candidatus Binatia bacterium]|nr:MAG: hypothetical protein KatS3mg077_3221 [Candidatus Binatia bacterium]